MTKAINYSARVLSDGHLSLPDEIRREMGLAVNSIVKVTLKTDKQKERAIKAFGAWAGRSEIKNVLILQRRYGRNGKIGQGINKCRMPSILLIQMLL
jgi:bifunctional DNA-binding transcriptional regulator/antitoxin component of YhaV-PrlF toxin-antitoxin module